MVYRSSTMLLDDGWQLPCFPSQPIGGLSHPIVLVQLPATMICHDHVRAWEIKRL